MATFEPGKNDQHSCQNEGNDNNYTINHPVLSIDLVNDGNYSICQ